MPGLDEAATWCVLRHTEVVCGPENAEPHYDKTLQLPEIKAWAAYNHGSIWHPFCEMECQADWPCDPVVSLDYMWIRRMGRKATWGYIRIMIPLLLGKWYMGVGI